MRLPVLVQVPHRVAVKAAVCAFFLLLLSLASHPSVTLAADPPPQKPTEKEKDKPKEKDEDPGPPQTEYMGRTIAQTMHWSGAPWLIRKTRDSEENTTLVLKQLDITPGMTVCDLGCGNGYYTLKASPLVGPTGRVLAEEVQPEMLDLLRTRAKKISNC